MIIPNAPAMMATIMETIHVLDELASLDGIYITVEAGVFIGRGVMLGFFLLGEGETVRVEAFISVNFMLFIDNTLIGIINHRTSANTANKLFLIRFHLIMKLISLKKYLSTPIILSGDELVNEILLIIIL
jgi:hypothetical protein